MIKDLMKDARETAARRGSVSAEYWVRVEEYRQKEKDAIGKAWDEYKGKTGRTDSSGNQLPPPSGNEVRNAINAATSEFAASLRFLNNDPRFASVVKADRSRGDVITPSTDKEVFAAKVQEYIDDYYALVDDALLDKGDKSAEIDFDRLLKLRHELRGRTLAQKEGAEIVREAEDYLYRTRPKEYALAIQQLEEYQSIPKYKIAVVVQLTRQLDLGKFDQEYNERLLAKIDSLRRYGLSVQDVVSLAITPGAVITSDSQDQETIAMIAAANAAWERLKFAITPEVGAQLILMRSLGINPERNRFWQSDKARQLRMFWSELNEEENNALTELLELARSLKLVPAGYNPNQ
jgi:hypothetical protein